MSEKTIIKEGDGKGSLDVKRFIVPNLSIKAKCPYCGEMVESNQTIWDGYFSYPEVNQPITLNFYHEYIGERDEDYDEHEFYIENVILKLDIDISNASEIIKYE